MHEYYHNDFSENKQNQVAQTRDRGGSAVFNLGTTMFSLYRDVKKVQSTQTGAACWLRTIAVDRNEMHVL
jgi:hypothetical protein